jgi:SAM-dependent methyltransferase
MKAKAFYETIARHGAAADRRVHKAADLLRRHAPPSARFVDIGCGAGVATRYIADLIGPREVYGIDISENRVAEARALGIDARVSDLDSERLPLADASFDAIHCGEVIEHVVDTDQLLDEIKRVLAPGGVCVLSTPNLAAWHNRAALMLGYQPFLTEVSFRYAPGRPSFAQAETGGGHVRMFTRRALLEFVRLHGFELLEECGAGVFELGDPPGSRFAKMIVNPVDSFFTHFPGLACDLLVAFRHRGPGA